MLIDVIKNLVAGLHGDRVIFPQTVTDRETYLLIHPEDNKVLTKELKEEFKITNPFINVERDKVEKFFDDSLKSFDYMSPEFGTLHVIVTQAINKGKFQVLAKTEIHFPETIKDQLNDYLDEQYEINS